MGSENPVRESYARGKNKKILISDLTLAIFEPVMTKRKMPLVIVNRHFEYKGKYYPLWIYVYRFDTLTWIA